MFKVIIFAIMLAVCSVAMGEDYFLVADWATLNSDTKPDNLLLVLGPFTYDDCQTARHTLIKPLSDMYIPPTMALQNDICLERTIITDSLGINKMCKLTVTAKQGWVYACNGNVFNP